MGVLRKIVEIKNIEDLFKSNLSEIQRNRKTAKQQRYRAKRKQLKEIADSIIETNSENMSLEFIKMRKYLDMYPEGHFEIKEAEFLLLCIRTVRKFNDVFKKFTNFDVWDNSELIETVQMKINAEIQKRKAEEADTRKRQAIFYNKVGIKITDQD